MSSAVFRFQRAERQKKERRGLMGEKTEVNRCK
jgi:hypothetical protein